jgi:hypothetical protein
MPACASSNPEMRRLEFNTPRLRFSRNGTPWLCRSVKELRGLTLKQRQTTEWNETGLPQGPSGKKARNFPVRHSGTFSLA